MALSRLMVRVPLVRYASTTVTRPQALLAKTLAALREGRDVGPKPDEIKPIYKENFTNKKMSVRARLPRKRQ
jgi:hypothetical protein